MVATGIVSWLLFYESPEQCFVREMSVWADRNELTDKVKGLTQDNEKLAVSIAKAIVKESNPNRISDDDGKIYLRMVILLDYCGVSK